MYLKEEDFERWVDHINSLVGPDSPEGAFLAGEKSNVIDINMAGDRSELAQILAAAVYRFSKIQEIAFEDAMTEISDAWQKIRDRGATMKCGDEVIDAKTGIGFNDKTEMVSLPIPPKDIQDKMQEWIQTSLKKIKRVTDRLHSVEDIMAFFKECTEAGWHLPEKDDPEDEKFLRFVYEGDTFCYYPDSPGSILCVSDSGVSEDFFEEDELFREVVLKLLEQEENG